MTTSQKIHLLAVVLGTRKITPEKKYPGIGINLMAHIKNVRIPFSVDIGVDDVIVPGAVKRTVATRLEGFEEQIFIHILWRAQWQRNLMPS